MLPDGTTLPRTEPRQIQRPIDAYVPTAAQVLAVLVEHAGDIVTRDTLRRAVWGDGTYVDFDKGLNFAIGQVRAALGDSADNPTFIRTFILDLT